MPTRREIPDGLLRGLYFVVQPSGAKSWAVRYRYRGRPKKLTLGSYPAINLARARQLASRALMAVAEGRDPCREKKAAKHEAEQVNRDLFPRIADEFVERHAKPNTRESSWRETRRLLNRDVVPQWKNRSVQDITRRDVIELLDAVRDRGSPIMANRILAAVRRLFRWCIDRGIVEVSPCGGLRSQTAEMSRDRVLTDSELRLVWLASDEIGWPFGPFVKLLILTGQRLNEVARMRWGEIDFEAKVWTIPRERTKNDIAHRVPLGDQAIKVLTDLPKVGDSGFVFTTTGPSPVGGFSRAKSRLDAAVARAMVLNDPPPRWVFHDLRRTTATGMAVLRISVEVVEKVLNHASGTFGGVVGVYQRHSFEDEKREALDAWGNFVEHLIEDVSVQNGVIGFSPTAARAVIKSHSSPRRSARP